MSEYTSNLQLFKYDTATDGKEVFSINASMNDNWDKIDAFAAGIKSLSNLDEQGEKRFTDINAELNKKLEAEVLLAENGYIKFNKLLCYSLPFLINYIQYIYNIIILYIQLIFSWIFTQIKGSFSRPFFRLNFGLFLPICKDKFYDKENYLRRFSCQNIQTI